MTCSLACCLATAAALLALVVGLSLHMWPVGCCEHVLMRDAHDRTNYTQFCPTRESGFQPKHMQTKGFTILPDFLTQEEVKAYLELWATKPEDFTVVTGGKGGVRRFSHEDVTPLHDRINSVVQAVSSNTDLELGKRCRSPTESMIEYFDTIDASGSYFHTDTRDPNTVSLGWHQDVEMSFLVPEVYNHLSLYIFVDKPVPGSGGLSLVPFDAMHANSPELHDLLVRNGGTDMVRLNLANPETVEPVRRVHPGMPDAMRRPGHDAKDENITFILSMEHDRRIVYHNDVENLACTPELKPGDAILFRGDVVHRTQGHSVHPSWRTSMNLRLGSLRHQGLAQILLQGGLTKFTFFSNAHGYYKFIFMVRLVPSRARMCADIFGSGRFASVCESTMFVWDYAALTVGFETGVWYRRVLFAVREAVASVRNEVVARYRA